MKNIREVHDFAQVPGSGYDAEQDGDDPRWGRIDVECRRCHEKRRIGAPIDEVNLTGGCYRRGGPELRPGDLLVTAEGYLETFFSQSGSQITTRSLGNTGYHQYDICQVSRPS